MKTLHKHYALNTRKAARQVVNYLKGLGFETTQPTAKNCGHWLVSTCTKFKRPTPKKVYSVVYSANSGRVVGRVVLEGV